MISMEENYQNQNHFPPSTISADTSSFSCPFRLNPRQDQEENHLLHHHHHQETNDLMSVGGPSSHSALNQTTSNHNQQIEDEHAQGSTKWMSSKMRLMKKMLGTDQILTNKQRRSQSLQDQTQLNQASRSSNISSNEIIRVCSSCKTTKTPLWRSGPQGPKSLCNACGIRQMKARRAMRAAAGLSNSLINTAECKIQKEEEKRSDVDRTVPFKKRFKIVTPASSQKKIQFDDIAMSLRNKLAFHQTFPQEEKDAAILLMALSGGLIHG
ncbi:uncharacterized protein A4U43_C08F5040 [Asparagus officinalis]|uniref:putative GATA transcription factor 22 isoform X2 n=1 Tax=Asparagus officinalis TaxID=4686 RepID=UPI00098E04F6|nr:putative GATA transcription factor 22 isoform X2 [Asparagus officinalis]ONK59301.1 uncharacterized protein A4U43_C08F5040 [Asparagus officinalis]